MKICWNFNALLRFLSLNEKINNFSFILDFCHCTEYTEYLYFLNLEFDIVDIKIKLKSLILHVLVVSFHYIIFWKCLIDSTIDNNSSNYLFFNIHISLVLNIVFVCILVLVVVCYIGNRLKSYIKRRRAKSMTALLFFYCH